MTGYKRSHDHHSRIAQSTARQRRGGGLITTYADTRRDSCD